MSRGPSRSSTPSRLHSSISSSVLLGGGPSTSRSRLPPPKVLPWPDMSNRTTMSRENSRGHSPLGSPGLSPRASYADALSLAIPGIPTSASAHDLRLPGSQNNRESSTSRFAHSASPSGSSPPEDLTTPRPLRPRAATTSAAPSGSSSAAVSTPPQNRQVEFHPVAPSPVIPILSHHNLMPAPSASPVPALPQSPTHVRPASIVHDPTPPSTHNSRPMSTKKLSNPPVPLPSSIPVSPQPPPGPLVDHLYRSFRTGACADVRVWVRRWNVGWLVHRMVLVQAGFFHSLFMGGFAETRNGKGNRRPSHFDDDFQGEDIELVFDDPNITRAAFEICLSRLYSQYPQFHFPVALLPTAAQPLTPSFPPGAPFPSLEETYHNVPVNIHLATPRLLLSLLATSTYLGLTYLMREVLAIVLRTVGPSTVVRYLGFAIGDGIGETEWEGQDEEGARGLEKIARIVSSGLTAHESDEWISEVESDIASHEYHDANSPGLVHRSSTDSSASDEVHMKVGDSSVSRSASMKSNSTARPPTGNTLTPVDEGPAARAPVAALPHFYGFVSDKVGEACVCWLARWGLDVLNVETSQPQSMPGHGDMTPVWGYGGIPAKFAAAVLSSDALFVPNERGRYHMARRVLELRREGYDNEMDSEEVPGDYDPWEEEEREIAKAFADGIYYSHMSFEDLSAISSDIDPDAALPYAPLAVLQAAHWSAADLKTRITSGRAINNAREGELGLTKSASEISSMYGRRRSGRGRMSPQSSFGPGSSLSFSSLSLATSPFATSSSDVLYHPIPDDDTHRIGAGGLLFFNHHGPSETLPGILGMPDLGPDLGPESKLAPTAGEAPKRGKTPPPTHGENTFFGIQRGARLGPEIDAKYREEGGSAIPLPGMDKVKQERWSKTEPFRFSVEFWGVDKLAEKERLYSQTHFYAGSYFNVYVSTIRKKDKGVQLGIYLHRQATNEPFPTVSSAGANSSPLLPSDPPTDTHPGMPLISRTFSVSPPVLGSPEVTRRLSLPDTTSDDQDTGTYTDPREVTKAYFSITCASALGTAMVRFSSAPDSFAISQSWGWKSSALRSEEYLSVPVPAEGDSLGWVGESEGGSLRATVVVGII